MCNFAVKLLVIKLLVIKLLHYENAFCIWENSER